MVNENLAVQQWFSCACLMVAGWRATICRVGTPRRRRTKKKNNIWELIKIS